MISVAKFHIFLADMPPDLKFKVKYTYELLAITLKIKVKVLYTTSSLR